MSVGAWATRPVHECELKIWICRLRLQRTPGPEPLVNSAQAESILDLITSAEGGYVFTSVCLSVCLSVCPADNWKSCEQILTKFLGRTGHGSRINEFNFGDDPDHHPDPGVWNPHSLDYRKVTNRFWWNFMEIWGEA